MKHENGLFIFRRDLRLKDNLALNKLFKTVKNVYTIFIFTREQVESNKFSSKRIIHFMIECLVDLGLELKARGSKLYTFYGDQKTIIPYLVRKLKINAIGFNVDYTPYAMKRDANLIRICELLNIQYVIDHDYVLQKPGSVYNGSGDPYKKFTPFYKKHTDLPVKKPSTLKIKYVKTNGKLQYETSTDEMDYDINNVICGGRKEALKVLLSFKHKTYNSSNTSNLSSYIKFGCISIREVYNACKMKKSFIRQLVWRDFYYNIVYFFPHVMGSSMKLQYNEIKWSNNKTNLKAWSIGKSGYPIVDAGIRQLISTGEIDNRLRLIVGSFLVKTLLFSWQVGEKFFAKHLLDYDPAINNGNWQWIAGSGTDSQPYFRIFNPWTQGKTYDKDTSYIKKWIPELNNVPSKDIHKWYDKHSEYSVNYPKPIVDYNVQKKKAISMYKKIFE